MLDGADGGNRGSGDCADSDGTQMGLDAFLDGPLLDMIGHGTSFQIVISSHYKKGIRREKKMRGIYQLPAIGWWDPIPAIGFLSISCDRGLDVSKGRDPV